MQACVANVSHVRASKLAQSSCVLQLVPAPVYARQYGCASQVAHVKAAPQSSSVAHDVVHVPAIDPAVLGAQNEYVVSVHGASASQGSPSPATVTQTLEVSFAWPAAHPQLVPPTTTSSDAHGVQPAGLANAFGSHMQVLVAESYIMFGPQRSASSMQAPAGSVRREASRACQRIFMPVRVDRSR